MKKSFLIFLSISIAFFCNAQYHVLDWQKNFGGTCSDAVACIIRTNDNGYCLVGNTCSNDFDLAGNAGSSYNVWILKLDANYNKQWQRTIGTENAVFSIDQASDGSYILASHNSLSQAVYKLSSTGNIVWQGGESDGHIAATGKARATADGGCIHAAVTIEEWHDSIYGNMYGVFVKKYDANGTVTWSKTFSGSLDESIGAVSPTADGGYILCGSSISNDGPFTGNHGNYDVWVIKLDANGNTQWKKMLGGMQKEMGIDITQTFEGGYILLGTTQSNDGDVSGNQGDSDIWLVKLNPNGVITWQSCLGGADSDNAKSVMQTNDSGYLIGGSSKSSTGNAVFNYGDYDAWILKTSPAGTLLWQKTLGGTLYEGNTSVISASNGGYMVAATSLSSNGDVKSNYGSYDIWLAHIKETYLCKAYFTVYPNGTPQNWYAYDQSVGAGQLSYVWNWGDGTTSTIATPTHTYASAATYDICLTITDSTGCTSSYCDSARYIYKTEQAVTITVINQMPAVTGISDIVVSNNTIVFPNPATTQLQINSGGLLIEQVNIYNITGQLIASINNPGSRVDVSALASGLYIAEIKSGNKAERVKWIKQ